MDLLIRIETATNEGQKLEDVRVNVVPDHTVGELATALRHHFDRPAVEDIFLRTDSGLTRLAPETTIAGANLVSGDVLILGGGQQSVPPTSSGPAPSQGMSQDSGGTHLVVVSGIDAGLGLRLTPGSSFTVGRGEINQLALSDPQVSRHGDFTVSMDHSGELFIDAGSNRVNELRLGGVPIEGQAPLPRGEAIQVGASTLAVREMVGGPQRATDAFGAVPYHRTPYMYQPLEPQEFEPLGRIPVKPKPRRFQFIAAAAPLLTGAIMALVIGSPRFMLFAIMSPVIAIGTHFDNKRTGGNDYAEGVAALGGRISDREQEVQEALEHERAVRNQNSPDTVQLVEQARRHDKSLWVRSRASEDFMKLRIGLGTVEPNVSVAPERQGDDELKDQVAREFVGIDQLVDVPITVDLRRHGIVSLVGKQTETSLVATSLAMQASCLHSPEDLVIASATSHQRGLNERLKWLPHVRSKNSPIGEAHLAGDRNEADELLRAVARVAEARALSKDRQLDLRWPWILLLIDRSLEPDPGTASRLFDLGASVGVSVLWLTDDDRRVPRQSEIIAELRSPDEGELSSLAYVDPDIADISFEPDRLGLDLADQAARALAPLRDASAVNAAAAVPSLVTLFQALGESRITPEWVAGQWLTDRGYSLPTPVGLADSGPVVLDLVKHGPHGLIGGTSGAGKSELVQSLVANLIALNSPERVNLLFVDYKGGALSGLFSDVPHSVGAVTNLDALLSLRALTSLKAELDRRMALFETKPKVKDLRDMLEFHPDEAPPSLVIVVDEFAALVRELPEFVEGIVSIAERGRSLGIHLLLSTQRPSGSINENIQQNTNLRISLRMLDSNESNNVIGTPDAATIPGHLKGRAFARLGPGELIAFQSSWSGAPLREEAGAPPIAIAPFYTADQPGAGSQPNPSTPTDGAPTQTQLDAVIAAVVDAAKNLNLERGRAPWKDTLPELVALIDVLNDPRSARIETAGTKVAIGMIDDPEAQDQYPLTIDLSEGGGVVIYGNGGSGKTTALRTIACSAAIGDHQLGGGNLTIFGLDFASRQLGSISDLPQCDLVANGDDLEAVTRMVALLDQRFNERQAAIADAVAKREAAPMPATILVIIDGYDELVDRFTTGAVSVMQPWLDRLGRLISQGRQVGIYTAISTSAFSGASARLMNTMSNRVVLRQTDENIYRVFGVPAAVAQGLVLNPGQALSRTANLMQVAAICRPGADGEPIFDPSALRDIGVQLKGAVAENCRSEPLPDMVNTVSPTGAGSLTATLGLADLTQDPVTVDLDINSFCVFGPRRSGRSTTLATIARQLLDAGHEVWALGPRGSRLANIDGWAGAAFDRSDKVLAVLEELNTAAESFPDIERFLIFDDADQFDEPSLNGPLKSILASGVRCLGSAIAGRNLSTSNPMQKELKSAATIMVLKAEDESTLLSAVGPRFYLRPGLELPAGRGVLVVDGLPTVTQVADIS